MIQNSKHNSLIHIKQGHCVKNPAHYDNKIFLSLDKKQYFCQMGCPGLMDQKKIAHHMINTHTKEELWRWSINYDKLVTALNCSNKV